MNRKTLEILRDESGSLVVLIFSLFLLLLVSSFSVIDLSDSFLAKRELVQIGEVAITRAAHQISLSRYYSGNILMDNSGVDGAQFRVPIDCQAALLAFQTEISSSMLRDQQITIAAWDCQDDAVTGTLQARIPLLVKLPFGIGANGTTIDSTIGATSIVGGSRG